MSVRWRPAQGAQPAPAAHTCWRIKCGPSNFLDLSRRTAGRGPIAEPPSRALRESERPPTVPRSHYDGWTYPPHAPELTRTAEPERARGRVEPAAPPSEPAASEPSRDQVKSIHEASHVIACLATGMRCPRASIVADHASDGRTEMQFPKLAGNGWRHEAHGELIRYISGSIGELLAFGKWDEKKWGSGFLS